MPGGGRVRLGGPDPFAATHPFQARGTHQPPDLITADVMAGAAGGLPQLAHALDPVVVLPERPQHRAQEGVTLGPRRRGARLDLVVGAGGRLHACRSQDRADGLDPELLAAIVDDVDYFLC